MVPVKAYYVPGKRQQYILLKNELHRRLWVLRKSRTAIELTMMI